MSTTSLKPKSSRQLWLEAIKPPMYSVAVIPITVGTAVAFAETQVLDKGIFSLFLLAAIAIIAWLNISNDVFDADTGIDVNKPHSVVNLTGNRDLMFWLSNLFLLVGIGGIFTIAYWQQDATVLGLVVLCCVLGYSYQGPPFRFGYRGWGEIICFICFGPLAITAAYYSQTQSFSLLSLAAGIIIGLTTAIILFCSHFHQVEDDKAAGKRSPIVKLGTARGAKVLTWSLASVYLLSGIFILLGYFSPWAGLIFLSLPVAYQLATHVQKNHPHPELVSNSKFIAVRFHFLSGMLLASGFLIG